MKTEIPSAPAKVLAFCATVLVFSFCVSGAPVWAQEGLAQRYENTAREMLVKVEEQKKRLQHFDDKSLSLWQSRAGFPIATLALLRKYDAGAAEEATNPPFSPRQGFELAKRDNAAPAEIPRQLSSR